eukprot:CAMPEP_0114551798 /NCGR_PEP_ID=MMETSP0114-20121206/6791_1 /TAXON_ID=31324 /ORGANISM="Goniomonas sp, Strain m" /LENGTH=313 /DNA_ID=CAMNT_0001736647 /DNA_START=150 /DNA_END=1091 /DNA_ORIENTATION=-
MSAGLGTQSQHSETKRTHYPSGPEAVDEAPIADWAPSKTLPQSMKRVNELRAGRPIPEELQLTHNVPPGEVYQLDPDSFEYFQVRKAPLRTVKLPCEGGYFGQKPLVPSTERQEALFIESKRQYAEKELRKSQHEEMRTGALMQKRFPLGVLGLENPSNPETIVYADTHKKWKEEHARSTEKLERMRANNQRHSRSYNILQTAGANEQLDATSIPLFASRKKIDHHQDNHARLFGGELASGPNRRQETWVMRLPKPGRAQGIRDLDTNGRPYNIISGAAIEHFPPTVPEKVVTKHLHYSLNKPCTPSHVKTYS